MKKLSILGVVAVFSATTLFAFTKQVDNLNNEEIDKFILGKSFYRIPWVEAPSATTARDGLGPLFNANTCMNCHPNNAKGSVFNKKGNVDRSTLFKLSIAKTLDKNNTLGFEPDPRYGAQISINGVHGVKYEAKPQINYKEKTIKYPDGSTKNLRVPTYTLTNLNYGELDKDTIISVRMAPALIGLGLLHNIDKNEFLKNVDENDNDNDGISGKANFVYNVKSNKFELGLYTYKASAPTIHQQIASAFHNDMSLTTSYYENENCTQYQKECNDAPKARDAIDVTDERVDAIAFYLMNLEIPKSKNIDLEGKELFTKLNCVACHIPSFKTKDEELVSPYSDFLLHDMGEGLADGRSEFDATSSEWRTAPLWGTNYLEKALKKKPEFLHDGRARDIEEAILWHDGEARGSKLGFMNLEKKKREQLIKFVEGL